MAFAAHQARLSAPYPDGSTLRDHKQAIVNRGPGGRNAKPYARAVSVLQGPPFPEALAEVWGWYHELRVTQRVGMAGIEPISYGDLRDWAELTARAPEPFHVDLIIRLDHVVRRESAPHKPTTDTPTTDTPTTTRDAGKRRRG